MDEVKNEMQGKVPWYMFADGIVFVGKNLEEINHRLDEWE